MCVKSVLCSLLLVTMTTITAMLVSVAEFTNIVSVVAVLLCFCVMILFITRLVMYYYKFVIMIFSACYYEAYRKCHSNTCQLSPLLAIEIWIILLNLLKTVLCIYFHQYLSRVKVEHISRMALPLSSIND